MMEPKDDYSPEQRERIAALDPSRVAAIDAHILASATGTWRKMSYVVGLVMAEIPEPDLFVAERIRILVAEGALQSQGQLGQMRYCEVRLAQGD